MSSAAPRHPQTGRDHVLRDFIGYRSDPEQSRIPPIALHVGFHRIPHAAQQLDAHVRGLYRTLGSDQLREVGLESNPARRKPTNWLSGTARRSSDITTAAMRCTAAWWRMCLADERFTRYYDDVEAGLAQFLHDIVVESLNS